MRLRKELQCEFLGIFAYLTLTAGLGCGGGGTSTAPATSAVSPTSSEPRVVIEDSTETWYEEESGTAAKGTSIREYVMDVTKEEGVKGTTTTPAAPGKQKVYRVSIRFPVPKVQPPAARDVHTVNRLLWDVRKEMAKCFYKGPGKEPGAELSMIGFLKVSKTGDVTGSGVEKSDAALKSAGGFEECVMENVKGLVFKPAGDDAKIRFKLKMQTQDVTGGADVKAPVPAPKKE